MNSAVDFIIVVVSIGSEVTNIQVGMESCIPCRDRNLWKGDVQWLKDKKNVKMRIRRFGFVQRWLIFFKVEIELHICLMSVSGF